MRSAIFKPVLRPKDARSDVTRFGSFDNSTCKRVLDLLEQDDTVVKHLTDSVHSLSILAENAFHNWHGARYYGRHDERRLCSYRMTGCFAPCLGLVSVHRVDHFANEWLVCLWPGGNFDVCCAFTNKATHHVEVKRYNFHVSTLARQYRNTNQGEAVSRAPSVQRASVERR